MNNKRSGFTLLEMSIVLVIIGVLVGGVLLGRSLMVTSRLQTVITDADSYITATANFRQQYQALPGDMASATSNWGTAAGCPTTAITTGTCNGNGDGQIGPAGSEYESFLYWQHLNLAGMFSQRLSGVANATTTYGATVGTNVPRSSIDGAGFAPVWEGTVAAGDANFFAGFYGNVLIFGAGGGSFLTSTPSITADQASSIDAKIDDGIPSTGKVRTFINSTSYAPNCASSTTAYNLTASGKLCSLIFSTGF